MADDAFSIKFDTSSLETGLDAIAAEAKAAVRAAAQAGAQVFYDEVLVRVPVSKAPRTGRGGKTILPGALKASIYQVYSQSNSTDDKATYHISWNYRKAPHGHLVEFGTSRAPAHPFLRPSFDAKAAVALAAANQKFAELMAPALTK